jgi:hypothetical protein
MAIIRVKQAFHPIFDVSRYIREPGMAHPVPRSILREGKLLQVVLGDGFIDV